MTSSFLTLIPKKLNPQGLYEYRPIFFVSSLYKILAKLLASILKRILGSLVSPCKTTFVSILDGVSAGNEISYLATKTKKDCLLFKVDFEKAYDRVRWDFLLFMIKKMGFGPIWMQWMVAYVFTSQMPTLVNGRPTLDFEIKKV